MTTRRASNSNLSQARIFISHRFQEHGRVVEAVSEALKDNPTFQPDQLDPESPQVENPVETSKQRTRGCDLLLVIVPRQLSTETFPYKLQQSQGEKQLSILEIEIELAMQLRKPILAFEPACPSSLPAPPESTCLSSTIKQLYIYTTVAKLPSCDHGGVAAAILRVLEDARMQNTLRLHVDYAKESARIWSESANFDEGTYTPRAPFRKESKPSNVVRFEDKLTQEGKGGVRFHFIVASSGVGKTTYINSFCMGRLLERERAKTSSGTSAGYEVGCSWFLSHPLVRVNGAQTDGAKGTSLIEDQLDLTERLARSKSQQISSEVWRSQAPCLLIDGFNQWSLFEGSRIIDALAQRVRDWNGDNRAVNIIITTRPHTFKAIESAIRTKLEGIDPSALQFDLPDLLFDEEHDPSAQKKLREEAYEKYRRAKTYQLPDSVSLPPEVFRLLLRAPVYFRLIGRSKKNEGDIKQVTPIGVANRIVKQTVEEVDALLVSAGHSPHYLGLLNQQDRFTLISEFFLQVAAVLVVGKRQTLLGAELSSIAFLVAKRHFGPNDVESADAFARDLRDRVASSEVMQDLSDGQNLHDRAQFRFRYDLVAEAHFACVFGDQIGQVFEKGVPGAGIPSGSDILREAMRLVAVEHQVDVKSDDNSGLSRMDEVHAQGTSLGLSIAISRFVSERSEEAAATWLQRLFELTRPKDRDRALDDDEYLFCVTLFKRAFVTAFVADERTAESLASVLSGCIETANPKTRVWAMQLGIDCLQNASTYYGADAYETVVDQARKQREKREKSANRIVQALRSTLVVGDRQVNDQGCIAVATLIGDPNYVEACIKDIRFIFDQIRGRSLLNLMAQTVAASLFPTGKAEWLAAGYALGSLRKLTLLLHEFVYSAAGRASGVREAVEKVLSELIKPFVADHYRRFEASPARRAVALRLLGIVFATLLRANKMPVNYRQWRRICHDADASVQFRQSCGWVDPNGALDTDAILASFCGDVPNAFLIQNLAFALSGRYFWSRTRAQNAEPDVLHTIERLMEKAKALEANGTMRSDALVAMRYALSLGLYHANSFAEDLTPSRAATALNVKLAEEMVRSGGTAYTDSDGRRATTNIIGTTIRSMLHADESEQAFLHIDRLTQTLPTTELWREEHVELASTLADDLALIAVLERGNPRVINKLFQLGFSAWQNQSANGQPQKKFCLAFGDAFVRVAGFYPRAVDDCLADRTGSDASDSVRNVVHYIHQARAKAWSKRQVGFDTDLSSWLFERVMVNISARLLDPESKKLVIPSLVLEFTEFLDANGPLVPPNALSALGALVVSRTAAALVATAPAGDR